MKTQKPRCRQKAFCNFIVFRGTFKLAGRVVMCNAEGGRPVLNNVGENFARVDNCLVYKADGYNPDSQNFMSAVQGKADKPLLFAVGIMADKRKNIGWLFDTRRKYTVPPPAEFQHCRNRACF